MFRAEFLKDGTLIQHYSDAGFMLLQNETGIKHCSDACQMLLKILSRQYQTPNGAEETKQLDVFQ